MTMPVERLRHLADVKRGIDDPQDIGYYESCALAEECLALRARVAELEAAIAAEIQEHEAMREAAEQADNPAKVAWHIARIRKLRASGNKSLQRKEDSK